MELSVRTAELIKASLETHYDEWYDHLTRKRCKAMECPACYTLYIDPALCNGCGKCLGAAPENAVVGGEGMIHVIKKDLLAMKTGEFAAVCPVGAIKKAGLVSHARAHRSRPCGQLRRRRRCRRRTPPPQRLICKNLEREKTPCFFPRNAVLSLWE